MVHIKVLVGRIEGERSAVTSPEVVICVYFAFLFYMLSIFLPFEMLLIIFEYQPSSLPSLTVCTVLVFTHTFGSRYYWNIRFHIQVIEGLLDSLLSILKTAYLTSEKLTHHPE